MTEPRRMAPVTDPVNLVVDGQEVQAQKGELLIDACERNGAYIPRFCYHPRMEPVGMCRMCIVEVDTGRGPALQPSCMIECTDGMSVDTKSPTVQKVQDGVLEYLLINHPLDCPVCDKGGECPLQDQTLAYGPGESRFVEEKRHYAKPIAISSNVYLDRERCILCDRCTRFADEVIDEPLIHFIDRGAATQVNTFPDDPFESYFSGNTVEICPVGALTAKPYRFKARPWDLTEVESTCTNCAMGCRITVQSSRDTVVRHQGVDSDPVNWGWLCDKGRWGFQAIAHPERLDVPLVRSGDELVPTRWNDAIETAAEAIRSVARGGNGVDGVAVLGGARLTNEAAYAWAKLAKGVVGTDHVDAQLGDGLPADAVLGLPRTTIDGAFAPGSVVVWLGPDPKEEVPVLFIRLKSAIDNGLVQLVELSPAPSSITPLATVSLRYRPGEAASLAAALVGSDATDDEALAQARELVRGAGAVNVVLGRPSLAESASTVVDAAAALADGLDGVAFLPVLRRANVHGAIDMGLAPGLLPGRVRRADAAAHYESAWGRVPGTDGLDAAGILEAAADGRIDVLVLLGADPISDFPDPRLAERAVAGARTVIAVDTFLNESSRRADVVLPAAGFAEVDGTTTNLEGRVTVLSQKVTAEGSARPDWQIAAELALALGSDLGVWSVTELQEEIARLAPSHHGITPDVLGDPALVDGVVPLFGAWVDRPTARPDGPRTIGNSPQAMMTRTAQSVLAVEEPDPAQAAETSEGAEVDGPDPAAGSDAEAPPVDGAPAEDGSEGSTEAAADDATEVTEAAPATVALVTFSAPEPTAAPAADAYAFRMVARRSLYDQGTLVQHCEDLAHLAPGPEVRLHPSDLSTLGVEAPANVLLKAGDRSASVPTVADATVAKGTAVVLLQQGDRSVDALLRSGDVASDIRIEVVR